MIGFLAAAAAVLLVVSGLAKARGPMYGLPTVLTVLPALRVRRRLAVAAVRGMGVAELVVGAVVLTVGGRIAGGALAVVYAGFAAVAVVLLARGQRGSCGCFGRVESPLGLGHLLLDLTAAASAAVTVAAPVGAFGGALTPGGATAAAGVVQIAILAALGYLAVTALPSVAAARRPGPVA